MALFSSAQIDKINKVAEKSKEIVKQPTKQVKSMTSDIETMSAQVIEYFSDSKSILITTEDQLAEYVDNAIKAGYCGIDTETTGLDRIKDKIVGSSLYYPGGVECYIPNKHLIPIFDDLRKNQLTYEQCGRQFQRLVDAKVKMIFANADFDIAMLYKDYKVDFIPACYYDVILAWRCIKENELHNGLKELYNKYVLKGKGDPKKFNDFFDVALFPYCKPEVAKLYAANDAKITYDLFRWQLPYVTKGSKACTKNGLDKIADLVWGIEFPMIKVCAMMHRTGSYIDSDVAKSIDKRYDEQYNQELEKLQGMVQKLIDERDIPKNTKRPFKSGKEFNPTSVTHARYLCYDLLGVPTPTSGKEKGKQATSKEVLAELNLPETNQLLKVRSLSTLIGTFVKKLPKTVTPDSRIHAQFRSVGASTGRMCIAEGTLITCMNGQKTIEEIKPGDMVYCYDMSGGLHLAPVKNLWLTGENRECVDIKWQSSGSGDIGHLICTPEHLILTKDGKWVKAAELTRYTKVVHLRRTVGSPEYRPTLYGWNGLCTREQDIIKSDIFHAPSYMIIHHDNEDPSNNDMSNLKLVTHSEHCKIHATRMQSCGILKAETLYCAESQKKAHETLRKNYEKRIIASKDTLIQKIKDAKGRISYVDEDYENFLNKCKIAGIDVEAECRKYNPRYHKVRIPRDEFVRVYEEYGGLAIRLVEHFGISYDKFYRYCDEYDISRNHTVQSVRPCGRYKVYDIEVEGYHNFIASEICVHNSSAEPNLQNIPSHATDIRHMFRATAARDDVVLCHETENIIECDLFKYDNVYLKDGSLKKVHSLTSDDVIKTIHDRSICYLKIDSIEPTKDNMYHLKVRINL